VTPEVTVGALLASRPEASGLPLEVLAGRSGMGRAITSPHIQKTGLALAGFHEYLKPGRVLIFGESEIRYLESLDALARTVSIGLAVNLDFPCVIITGGFTPPHELVAETDRVGLPLLKTTVPTPTAIAKLTSILEDSLAERTIIHAVLMDILGLGVLISGESGIGKSECALDLIVRGHRLVADVSSTSTTFLASRRRDHRSAWSWSCSSSDGIRRANTSGSASTITFTRFWGSACPSCECPWRPAGISRFWWRLRHGTNCSERAGTMRLASWRSGWMPRCDERRWRRLCRRKRKKNNCRLLTAD
jgi:hypothetical protein